MKNHRWTRHRPVRFATLAGLLMLAAGLLTAAAPAAFAATTMATGHRAGNTGWIRLAHLSPNPPPTPWRPYARATPARRVEAGSPGLVIHC